MPAQTQAHEAKVYKLIPSLPANTKLNKVGPNTHMAMQLHCKACQNIANNPTLPQPCKEVLYPCMIEVIDIVIFLLVFTPSFLTNKVQWCASGPYNLFQDSKTAHLFAKDHIDPKS